MFRYSSFGVEWESDYLGGGVWSVRAGGEPFDEWMVFENSLSVSTESISLIVIRGC